MTNKQHPKVRLVKCPKCAKILPEPEHVPLYACGGCGTTLQAKNYRGSHKDTELCSHEQDVTRSNGSIHARNGGESSGSSRRSSSSGEHLSVQDKGKFQDAVEKSSDSEQDGAANAADHTSYSKGSSFLKKNGQMDSIMDQFVLKDQNERRDWEAVQICSYSEQNEVENSGNHIAFSEESRFLNNKENGETESKLDQFDLKDPNKEKDQDALKRFSNSEQNGTKNSAHHTTLSEESSFMENKENGVIDSEMDQFDSKDQVDNDYPTVLGNKEPEQLIMENSAIEVDTGQDEQCNGIVVENHHEKQRGDVNHDRKFFTVEDSQVPEEKECQQLGVVRESTEDGNDDHEQMHVGYVNSVEDVSSLTESPVIKNPAEHHASDHQMSEETRKMYLVEKYSNQDQHRPKQTECVISAKHTSALIESPTIKNPAEDGASEYEVSEETRKMHVVGKNPHQDQYEQKQVGYVNSAKDASSLTKSLPIKKPTQLASENPAEYDAFDHGLSKETRKVHHVGEQSQQDISGNEIKCIDAEKPEVEKSGKECCSGTGPNDFVECIVERLGSLKLSRAALLSSEINQGENDDSVSETEDSLQACGSHSVSAPSNATYLKICHEKGTTKVSKDTNRERNSLDNAKGTLMKKINNFKNSAVYKGSEVGSLLKEIPRSPTKRSPAYDGSVSSFDGNDDQVRGQPIQIGAETLSSNNAAAGYDGAEDSPEWNNILSERMINSNSRVQTQAGSSSLMLSDQKLKSSMVEEEGPLEENGIPQRNNRFRPNRDSFLPHVPYSRKSSEMAYETGSSSSYALHDEPPSHQMHHHPYRRRFPEAPLYREKEFHPMYYNYETSGEIYDRPKYHQPFIDRRRRAESWSQSGTLPRMPYSGEIFNGRNYYMHWYPDDRRWSAQLPPPAVCCHQGMYMGPTWENRWDPYDSYPTSPQQFVESESSCAWGHDTISLSDDQRQKDQILKRLREKRQALKREFHPIAGGAPFLTCYFCFNVLQLPGGFLLSRRRRNHKLQCGVCSRILEFSLENEGFLAPCETNVDKNVNLVASSHVNHSRQSSLNSADGKELLSRDSFGASGREKRKVIPGSSRNGERMEDLHDTARGRESKVTWKLPDRSKSPLHRLMGYSSPQNLLTGHEEDDVE